MSAQLSDYAQRTIDRAAMYNGGRVSSSKAAQQLRKRGLAVLRDGEWTLSPRAWKSLSEWVLRVIDGE